MSIKCLNSPADVWVSTNYSYFVPFVKRILFMYYTVQYIFIYDTTDFLETFIRKVLWNYSCPVTKKNTISGVCVSVITRFVYCIAVFRIRIHFMQIRFRTKVFRLIRIRIQFQIWVTFFPSVLADFAPAGSGSAFRMRIRIQEANGMRIRIRNTVV
jgi:hypothetical protein